MLSLKGYEQIEKELKKIIKNSKQLVSVMDIIVKYVDTNPMQKAYSGPRDLKQCLTPTRKKQTAEQKEAQKKGVHIRTQVESEKADKNSPM